MFNESDRRSEGSTLQIAMPHSRHRIPRALDRKQHRDAITDHIAHHRVSHCRPVRAPVTAAIQNAAYNQQLGEVREVYKLEKIVAQWTGKLFEPQRRMHSRQPIIDRDQLRVLPAGIHEVHELRQLFKAEKKKKVRIPVPPEAPELRREFLAMQKRDVFAAR